MLTLYIALSCVYDDSIYGCICIHDDSIYGSGHGVIISLKETWGAGVETQENKNIFVPLSKKDKTKKSNEPWT